MSKGCFQKTVLGHAHYDYYSQKTHEGNVDFGARPRTGKENSIQTNLPIRTYLALGKEIGTHLGFLSHNIITMVILQDVYSLQESWCLDTLLMRVVIFPGAEVQNGKNKIVK